MSARQHHYLSQFYLKGFTKGRSKKSKLTVIDFKEKKRFETIPRNVGGIRDFNRLDIDGFDPNALESMLSEFEGEAAKSLKAIEESLTFDGVNKLVTLNLLAHFALRSPHKRDQWKNYEAYFWDWMVGAILCSKQRYEAHIRQMKKSGIITHDNAGYDKVKKFYDDKEYDINIPNDRLILQEMMGINTILPSLFDRKWMLLKADEHSGPFITSDNPVNLSWIYPEKIPIMYRKSPGYGMNQTRVYFPISNKLALIGEFNGLEGVYEISKVDVATFNSLILYSAHNQIFTPKIGFHFIKDDVILEGDQLLKHLNNY